MEVKVRLLFRIYSLLPSDSDFFNNGRIKKKSRTFAQISTNEKKRVVLFSFVDSRLLGG